MRAPAAIRLRQGHALGPPDRPLHRRRGRPRRRLAPHAGHADRPQHGPRGASSRSGPASGSRSCSPGPCRTRARRRRSTPRPRWHRPRSSGPTGPASCSYHGPYREAVVRSLITLKALTYAAHRRHRGRADHLAARGHRRRAELGLPLLLAARRHDHAGGAAAHRLYRRGRGLAASGSGARSPATRATCRSCTGWPASAGSPSGRPTGCPATRDSAPVRIGNAAVDQRPARRVRRGHRRGDARPRQAGLRFDRHTWSLMRKLLDFLESTGTSRTRASGRCAGRGGISCYSKVMAWVAFDRAIRMAERGRPGTEERWRQVRDQIHQEVCAQGYDAGAGHVHAVLRQHPSWTHRCC